MKRYLVIAAALTCLATPSQAGLNEGIAAAAAGNYAQAASEFEPLAAAGDPAGQYYLAKLYLEGHGPSTDVARGVDLMTKAANGNYPEAQAQLGLMYAMGLGVQVDNALAYQWLSKAITALPDGTRRAVAVANRDAVLQRMNAAQRQTATGTAAPAEPTTATTEAAPAAAPAPEPSAPAETAEAEAAPAPEPAATAETAAVTPEPAPEAAPETAPAVAPAAAAEPTPSPAPEPAPAAEPAESTAPAAEAKTNVVDSEPEQSASVEVPATTPEPAAALATPASADAVKSGIRIQIMSVPNEDAAWGEWKRISKQFAAQLSDLTAVVETADLGTKGTFYRLQAGPFDSLAAAKDRCGKLKEVGLDCLVVGKQ